MLSKGDIKFIHSLSQKKIREETGLFIVEGEKMVAEAIESDFKVERVLYMDEIGEESMSRISLLSSPSPLPLLSLSSLPRLPPPPSPPEAHHFDSSIRIP